MSSLSKHTASGQALGYFFQLERSLSWLAKAPADSIIGIETEDDVVVKIADGVSIYEQDKSSVTTHPFLPSKKDLWKTLLIWAEAIENNEITLENSYFFLVTNKPKSDSLAGVLSSAKVEVEIEKALALLKEKGAQTTGKVKELVDKLFKYSDTLLSGLIKNISFQSGDTIYGDGLIKKLESDLQLDMKATDQNSSIIRELLGWVFGQVVNAWRNKIPAFIDRNAFHREKINIITNYRQSVIDEYIIELGKVPKADERVEWNNRYVKQLQLIRCTKEDIQTAIHHYLNSVSKRTLLAKQGYLTEKQLEELDRNLKEHWQSISRSRKISHTSLTPENLGQLIYFDTTSYDTTVGNYKLNSHFITKGSYHSLADKLSVGWHPEFDILLKENTPKMKKKKTNA